MHYYIYSNKSAWISSGSNKVTGITERDQNFGKDEIIEVKKFFYNNSFDFATRGLIQFDLTDLTTKVNSGKIPKFSSAHSGSASCFLRLYEAEGNTELSSEYTLQTFPISTTWDEGVGKFGDSPKVTDGVSWAHRSNKPGASAVSWLQGDSSTHNGPTVVTQSTSNSHNISASIQAFSYESPDINMDVTNTVEQWVAGNLVNNGFLLKFSGSLSASFSGSQDIEGDYPNGGAELDNQTFGQLKFFSNDTNTIYSPKLEVKWNDMSWHSGSTEIGSGSLNELTMSGATDNYLYMIGLKDSYKETETVKFRVGARKRYIQKTFDTTYQTATASYVSKHNGSYSILDVATGETLVPFSGYTSMSLDSTSNYFVQDLNGFAPDRVYKILFKVTYNDGQEQIYDDGFEFKIKR